MKKQIKSFNSLEKKRIFFLEIGFIIALATVLYALEYKSYEQLHDLTKYYNNYQDEDILPPLVLKEKEKIPTKPIPQTILNIVENNEEPEVDILIDVSDQQDEAVKDWIPIEEPDVIDDEPVYSLGNVKVWPEFPGGETAMYRFLADQFKIPRIDKEMGTQGKIYVEFVIDREGFVKDIFIKRGLSATADAEAIRVVKIMPRWKPAQQAGRAVSVQYILPISIKLM